MWTHKFLFTFQTTHMALTAEKRMKKTAYPSRLIPTPTEIFAECGFSLEVELDDTELEKISSGEIFPYAECYVITPHTATRRTLYEKLQTGCP